MCWIWLHSCKGNGSSSGDLRSEKWWGRCGLGSRKEAAWGSDEFLWDNAGSVLLSAAPGSGIQHIIFKIRIHIFYEKYALKSVKKRAGRTIAALENVTSGKAFKELDLFTLGKGIERGPDKSLAIHSSFLQTESNQAFTNSGARAWLASSGI